MITRVCSKCDEHGHYESQQHVIDCGFDDEKNLCRACQGKTPKVNIDRKELRILISDSVKDAAANFMCHDRKEDEELSRDTLDNAFRTGIITVEEVTEWFKRTVEMLLED